MSNSVLTALNKNDLYEMLTRNIHDEVIKALSETNTPNTSLNKNYTQQNVVHINMIPDYDCLLSYSIGQIVRYNGMLYVCANHNVSGDWNVAKWKLINEIQIKKQINHSYKIDKREKLKRKRC